jgi:hypothetical protein
MTEVGIIATDGASPIRFLSTDGGDHPADAWAVISADQICDLIRIDPSSGSPEVVAARVALPRLRADIVAALVPHHAEHQQAEDSSIAADPARLAVPYDPTVRLGQAMTAVATATAGTPFEAHFRDERVKTVVAGILGSHLNTIAAARRSWAADALARRVNGKGKR